MLFFYKVLRLSCFLFMQDLVIILEAMRIIAIALSPVTPNLCWRIYEQLGYSNEQFGNAAWVNLNTLSLRLISH